MPLQQVRLLTGVDCLLLGWPIPLNRATTEDLRLVPGIGPVLAERIVAARGEQGGFRSFDDLGSVRGVGPRKLEALRVYLFVDPVKNPSAPP
jgi:competence protein ComEA